jgi:hypothetical protein
MKIELKEVSVRDLVDGYINNDEDGCMAYGGRLNVRPAYQREFIYKDKQRNAVIETLRKDFPLNVMYWVKNSDGSFELLDGQQRTISICEFVDGNFSLNHQEFHNLEIEEREQILNYKLMVYFCEGENREKLNWFETINIAGIKLSDQELRNAIYTGTWLIDAKRYFSKTKCAAFRIGEKLMSGSPIRQDYLETSLRWISNDNIEDYMSKNQNKPNANELWTYFQNVINWVGLTFTTYREEMKGIEWGLLYNTYKDNEYDGKVMENKIRSLMVDDEVTNKKGIYEYVLTGDKKNLNTRLFSNSQKRTMYESRGGGCNICKNKFNIMEMEADHITPWSEGGKTTIENGQMLCKTCNRMKSNK